MTFIPLSEKFKNDREALALSPPRKWAMKKIKKALGLLCGSTVVFLLFIGTDQSAVTNIAKGIVHTAWLSVAPILRDVSTAPLLLRN